MHHEGNVGPNGILTVKIIKHGRVKRVLNRFRRDRIAQVPEPISNDELKQILRG